MRLSFKPVEKGFRVRLMSPLGRYPTDDFCSESAALIISPEICFSIVRVPREDWSFSEVDILTALEIPLYSSILLAGEAGTPYLYPYPTDHSVLLETESLENIEERHVLECKSFLLEKVQEIIRDHPTSSFHKPPVLGGMKYDLTPSSGANGDRLMVLRRLETADPIILRGVSCLLKGRMAFKHPEFAEAACIFLWIALDAAHSLVLQKLRKAGIVNPTSKDAAKYFEEISGHKTEWDKFFEDATKTESRQSTRTIDSARRPFRNFSLTISWN